MKRTHAMTNDTAHETFLYRPKPMPKVSFEKLNIFQIYRSFLFFLKLESIDRSIQLL